MRPLTPMALLCGSLLAMACGPAPSAVAPNEPASAEKATTADSPPASVEQEVEAEEPPELAGPVAGAEAAKPAGPPASEPGKHPAPPPAAATATPTGDVHVLGALSAGGGAVMGAVAPAGKMNLTVDSAKGAVDGETAKKVILMAKEHFEACTTKAEKSEVVRYNKTMQLSFGISRKGTTSAVKLKGAEAGLAKCIVGIVRNLQFQDGKSKTKVTASLSFENPHFGYGGLGLRGVGPGGGGTGTGTIGLGSYGAIGHGSGTGQGGYGHSAGFRGNGAKPPQVRAGNVMVGVGAMDKNVIRRVIRQQLPRVRFCYERQLQARPTLSGKVVAQFEISPEGATTNVDVKGLDPSVSMCIAHALRTVRFPKPRGGGVVKVSYPFVFTPSP